MPLWVRYYDEDGDLSRTMTFSEFKDLGGRIVPAVMDMHPVTSLVSARRCGMTSSSSTSDVDQSFFSLQNLKRRR